ncbi:MAG: S-methyl-5-thioribose-1-phosphate isomerase [Myxococcota bacterium]|nr:S-methyl-5-thioribose-1-phosphate isomerase [Myxococcota bacterium]MEC8425303.1 S-methyl-5-thioribose-1-phosphate isomerase [Myxococcota bacterium]
MTSRPPRLEALGLRYGPEGLFILDQTRLPDEELWCPAADPALMVRHISTLRVRGAPMIGVCAALSLACAWRNGMRGAAFEDAATALRTARPTAVNLMHAVDTMLTAAQQGEDVPTVAEALFREDVDLCDRIAASGAPLIGAGERVLTLCNTGGLATAGIGTAAGVIRRAHADRGVSVLALETRPLLQGARLTAWEFLRAGIPVTLLTDGMAGWAMATGRVDRVLVGADRIARNGDFANKIGTLQLGILARHHGLPFHVVAPWTTLDPAAASASDIPIELRAPDEVRGARGHIRWAPADVPALNPAFDITPASLITSLVTDRGVFTQADLRRGVLG